METVLIKPNIDTVQISEGVVDQIYFWPVRLYFVERLNEIDMKTIKSEASLGYAA